MRNDRAPLGESKYHHIELSLQQCLWGGIEYMAAYARASDERADIFFFFNQYGTEPTSRPGFSSRPVRQKRHAARATFTLYDLDGSELSGDVAPDHYHHCGLSWTWPRVTVLR